MSRLVGAEYKEALSFKYPEQISILVVKDQKGKYNPITLGWVMNASHHPPMFAVSIGKTRYSLSAVRQAGEFTLNFPSVEMTEFTLFCGTHSGKSTEKITSAVKIEPAKTIDSLLLSDSAAAFECRLVNEMEAGDHIIFTAEVTASFVSNPPRQRIFSRENGRIFSPAV